MGWDAHLAPSRKPIDAAPVGDGDRTKSKWRSIENCHRRLPSRSWAMATRGASLPKLRRAGVGDLTLVRGGSGWIVESHFSLRAR
jgi:hypothetical protein